MDSPSLCFCNLDHSSGIYFRGFCRRFHFALKPTDCRSDVAQAAVALWIADVAGTLAGLNACCYSVNHCASMRGSQFCLNAANGMAEAIADRDLIICRLLLVNALPHLGLAKGLGSVHAEINGGAAGHRAKVILRVPQFGEGHRQQRLESGQVNVCARLSAPGAKCFRCATHRSRYRKNGR